MLSVLQPPFPDTRVAFVARLRRNHSRRDAAAARLADAPGTIGEPGHESAGHERCSALVRMTNLASRSSARMQKPVKLAALASLACADTGSSNGAGLPDGGGLHSNRRGQIKRHRQPDGVCDANLAPAVSPASTWFGVQVGLLPQYDYGSSGVKFGGIEAGFDTISPDGRGIVKPVLNVKLGAVTEGKLSPSVAAGIMQISPGLPSMNFLYLSATKMLQLGTGPSFGRLTLGVVTTPDPVRSTTARCSFTIRALPSWPRTNRR
jgi:hypothetical protein